MAVDGGNGRVPSVNYSRPNRLVADLTAPRAGSASPKKYHHHPIRKFVVIGICAGIFYFFNIFSLLLL